MNKDQAIEYMVGEIEKIERERLAIHLSIDPSRQKKEVVEQIIKVLREVQLDNED